MPDTTWLDDNIELYAADALPPDEEDRARSELAALAPVQRSIYDGRIAEIQSALGDWARAVAVDAPPELRERVLQAVSTVDPDGSGNNVVSLQDSERRHDPEGRADRAGRGRRIGLALVAAAAVVAAALGAGVLIGRSTAPELAPPAAERQQLEQIADVLAAPDASLSVGRLDGDRGVISVVSSRQRNEAVAQLGDRRAPIPSDSQFQMWLVGGSDQPVSAGLVPVGSSGAPLLVGELGSAKVLAVTVEPIGGSAQPTTPILVQVPLAT